LNKDTKTLSDVGLELPPESKDSKGIPDLKLFSKEMFKACIIKHKDLDKIKNETTKFGFAVRYKVNGVEKNFYSVQNYKNSELLANTVE
jgi:hypothetical protein